MDTKRTMLASAVALALSIATIAPVTAAPQSSGGTTGSSAAGAGATSDSSNSAAAMRGSSASSAQLASADRKFITEAASAGMFEVQAAQLAQSRAQDSQNKTYAQQMLSDHEKNNRQLMQIAQSKGVSPPTKLDAKHQAMLKKLQDAGGTDFDAQYAKVMDQSHSDTVKLFERGEKQVKDTELKSYISQTLPTLHQHHQQASSLPGAKSGSSRQAEAGSASRDRPDSTSGSGSMSDRSGSSSSMGSSTSGNTSSSDTTSGSSTRPGASSGNPDTSTPPKP